MWIIHPQTNDNEFSDCEHWLNDPRFTRLSWQTSYLNNKQSKKNVAKNSTDKNDSKKIKPRRKLLLPPAQLVNPHALPLQKNQRSQTIMSLLESPVSLPLQVNRRKRVEP